MDELSQGDGLEFNRLKTGTKSNEETEDEESMNFIEELKKPDQIAVKLILSRVVKTLLHHLQVKEKRKHIK